MRQQKVIRNHALISRVRTARSQSHQHYTHSAGLRLRSANLIQHSQRLISQSQHLISQRSLQIAPFLNQFDLVTHLKTDFVTRVNHEFRTPLTVIATATELLKLYHSQISDQKRQQYFQQIQAAIAQLIRLLETALTEIEDDV